MMDHRNFQSQSQQHNYGHSSHQNSNGNGHGNSYRNSNSNTSNNGHRNNYGYDNGHRTNTKTYSATHLIDRTRSTNLNLNIRRDYPILIPYQVDFNTTTVGKHIRQTKRNVIWRFGFAHVPSILNNKTGVACRGFELDIHLVWSIASGKHILYVNNVLVHETLTNGASGHLLPSQRFEYSFMMPQEVFPGNHVLHITAWALGIGSRAQLDQQFILTLDGQKYSEFYPIFMLGSERMKQHYAQGLAKVRDGIASGAGAGASANSDDDNNNYGENDANRNEGHNNGAPSAPAADLLGDRPRREHNKPPRYHGRGQEQGRPHVHPQPSAPYFSGTASVSSDPDLYYTGAGLGSSTGSGPSAYPNNYGQEEMKQMAKARLNSFRDLREQRERQDSYLRYGGGAGLEDDDMSIPTFARPPPAAAKPMGASRPSPSRTRTRLPSGGGGGMNNPSHITNLYAVQEDVDLLDVDNPPTPPIEHMRMARRPSDVTIDTAIKPPADDEMSSFSDVYSHLDPNQMWKTQQDVSFRLQRPPVYSDTAAGDLIQPSSSFSVMGMGGGMSTSAAPTSSNVPQQQQRYQYQNQHQPQYQTAPKQQQYQTTPQQHQFTTPPPLPRNNISGGGFGSIGGSGSDSVMSDAHSSMMRQTAPGFSTASFRAAPPPTWDSLNAAFAPSNAQPHSQQQNTQQYSHTQQQRQQPHVNMNVNTNKHSYMNMRQ